MNSQKAKANRPGFCVTSKLRALKYRNVWVAKSSKTKTKTAQSAAFAFIVVAVIIASKARYNYFDCTLFSYLAKWHHGCINILPVSISQLQLQLQWQLGLGATISYRLCLGDLHAGRLFLRLGSLHGTSASTPLGIWGYARECPLGFTLRLARFFFGHAAHMDKHN